MSDEVILKTSFLGFNRKEVMDYIETLQKENRELKKRLAALENPEQEPSVTAEEPMPKMTNVNLQSPLEDVASEPKDTSDSETETTENGQEPDNSGEKQLAAEPGNEDYEPEVAAAINKADEAIAKADESIVLNNEKYSDAITSIYNAVMEAVSHSGEIQVELENEKNNAKAPEENSSAEQISLKNAETEEKKTGSPVKVKVKIRPKKDE